MTDEFLKATNRKWSNWPLIYECCLDVDWDRKYVYRVVNRINVEPTRFSTPDCTFVCTAGRGMPRVRHRASQVRYPLNI